jgi:hypothetical protein
MRTDETKPIDLEKALLDPASQFPGPEDVVAHAELTREQKIEILLRWHYDASDLAVAEEEGMIGGEESKLRRVLLALEALAGLDLERIGPAKQHGFDRSSVGLKKEIQPSRPSRRRPLAFQAE